MPNLTENYGLKKPLPEEFYDVGVQNANMDIIDKELKKRATLGEDGKVPEEQLPDTTYIPVTSEVPSDSDIWIDPDDETVEDSHIKDKNNPHGVTAPQIGAEPAIESDEHSGCYYRMVNGKREWINPPMVIGTEYRTTERWNGKPVFTKAIDFGLLPDDGYKNMQDIAYYVDDLLFHQVSLFYFNDSSSKISTTVLKGVTTRVVSYGGKVWLEVTCNAQEITKPTLSEVSALFYIKYTKQEGQY